MMELGKALVESKKTLEVADQKIKSRDDALEVTRKTLQGTRRLSAVKKAHSVVPPTSEVVSFPFNSPQRAPRRGFSLLKAGSNSNVARHNQVLQVVLTPVENKLIAKHTKTSLLRLKNSPAKDPTRGRECVKNKENAALLKRRQAMEEAADVSLKKKRKIVSSDKKKSPAFKSRQRKSVTMGKRKSLARYNLRVRN
jgi:hypothetical protein